MARLFLILNLTYACLSSYAFAQPAVASDISTRSNYQEIGIDHFDFKFFVDPDKKAFVARTTFVIKRIKQDVKELVLDAKALHIRSVTDLTDNVPQALPFESVDPKVAADSFLGEGLKIHLKPSTQKISIAYDVAPALSLDQLRLIG